MRLGAFILAGIVLAPHGLAQDTQKHHTYVLEGWWRTCAVGPKVSPYWAQQKADAERHIEALKKSTRPARDAVFVKQARANKRLRVSAESAYLTTAYVGNFKPDLERLNLIVEMQSIGHQTVGTRDPEFLRMMFVTLAGPNSGALFGPSIGLGLIRVYPGDDEVSIAFIRSCSWVLYELDTTNYAKRMHSERLSSKLSKETNAYFDAMFADRYFTLRRRESDLREAMRRFEHLAIADRSMLGYAKAVLKLYEGRLKRGEYKKGT